MAKSEKTMVKFNTNILWGHFAEPNTGGKFPSGKYEFVCANLSPKAVEAIESTGLAVGIKADKPEQGHFIKCKSQLPFIVVNPDGTKFDELKSIGNGTKATVTITPYEYNYRGKKGLSPSTLKVVINELVEYTGPVVDDSDVETF